MKKQIISMVSETDPRYLEMRQESLRKEKHNFWGQDEILAYENDLKTGQMDRYKNTITSLEEDIERIDAELAERPHADDIGSLQLGRRRKTSIEELQYFKKELLRAERRFHKLFGDLVGEVSVEEVGDRKGKRTEFLRGELGSMFVSPETTEELRRYFGQNLEELTTIGLYLKISDPKTEIPADFLYRVLKNHHAEMCVRAERVEKMVEDLKAEFLDIVSIEIEAGRLPLDLETAKRRLALVVGKIADRLEDPTSRTTATHTANGLIRIYSSEIEDEQFDELRATIFHELIHELAGKSIQIVKKENPFGKDQRVRDRKTGVQIATESETIVAKRFTWLNEAITEWYAQRLSKFQVQGDSARYAYKGSVAYINERKELDRLFEKGLSEEVVLAAYFEDIHEGQPKSGRGQAFATLLKTINKLEEDQYAFARLENLFTLKEVTNYLRGKGIFLERSVKDHLKDELKTGQRLYPITFSVGVQDITRARQVFCYIVPADAAKTEKLLGDDYYMKKMETVLEEAKILSGGERCQYTIWDPDIVE